MPQKKNAALEAALSLRVRSLRYFAAATMKSTAAFMSASESAGLPPFGGITPLPLIDAV